MEKVKALKIFLCCGALTASVVIGSTSHKPTIEQSKSEMLRELGKAPSLIHYHNVIANPEAPLTIVILGDSNSQVNWATSGRINWVGHLTNAYSLERTGTTTIINASRNGAKLADGPETFIRTGINVQPDLVIIALGLNDAHDTEMSASESGLRSIIRIIRSETKASLLIRTPQPFFKKRLSGLKGTWIESQALERQIQMIRSVASEEKVAVLDHYQLWTDPDNGAHPSSHAFEWQHVNEKGHERFYRELAPVLGLSTELPWQVEAALYAGVND